MKIAFWILFIGAPWMLLFIFSAPGPAYFVTLLFHYPVWFALKFSSEFILARTAFNEPAVFFVAITIGLICTLNFYQMGGDGKPFEEIKAFTKIISSPEEISHSDKYVTSNHESRLRRSAALGKFYDKDLDLELPLILLNHEFRQIEAFHIEKKESILKSDLPNFSYIGHGDDYIITFEFRNKPVKFKLSEIEKNPIELTDSHLLRVEDYYDFGSGLSYFLYYYFKWFHN